ncbi:MAG: PepSY domain-containing protein [Sphaerochaetaceae bacterium]|nr:PepSY domain-containing protein [Sphaerochaetaceae bacterium]
MKKILSVLAVLIVFSFTAFAAYNQPSITEEQAKQIALTSAGVQENQCSYMKVKLDYDDGVLKYEVKFQSGHVEYEYDIDASNGMVLSMDKDFNGHQIPTVQNQSKIISAEDALNAAIKHAGVLKNSVTYSKVKQENDDGRVLYEVKFYVGRTGYEYEIDAYTSAVIKYEVDVD